MKFTNMKARLHKYIIHKLGGILPDEAPPFEHRKIDVIRTEYPIVPLKVAMIYEPGVATKEYIYRQLGEKLGKYMVEKGFIAFEIHSIDDWENECSARIDIVDRRE